MDTQRAHVKQTPFAAAMIATICRYDTAAQLATEAAHYAHEMYPELRDDDAAEQD